MSYVIGIDEAGRGALAGPVVVAAVAVPRTFRHNLKKLPKLRDSKKLSASQRAIWYDYLAEHPEVHFTSARVYQRGIDKMNIARSANIAASRSLGRLLDRVNGFDDILLDGSLYLGAPHHRDLPSKTIVRGDEKRVSIKLASIVAKVVRDTYLQRLDTRYPEYGFALHKGYGTRAHFKAIKKHGISDVHRLTYLGKYPSLNLEK